MTIMAAETMKAPDDLAQREEGKPPLNRTDQDAPTPLSVIRLGYDTAYRYFPRIRELESRAERKEDYNIVREIHAAILANMDRIPSWCRHDKPDLHFDSLSDCTWLPAARQSLTSGIYFVLLSLHRLYIFSVPESRTEALKAASMILNIQEQLFHLSGPKNHLSFKIAKAPWIISENEEPVRVPPRTNV